jgi:A/G-specific adenine glycosylase
MRNNEHAQIDGPSPARVRRFRKLIQDHYRSSGRSFPWRETTDPYAILVSEIMLQQTQTSRVVPKYLAFLERFPDFTSLANAPLSDVLAHWQGLGYNRRGKALRDLAAMVVDRFDGVLPEIREELIALPGIGPYTSGAVCAFAYNQPVVFMDTNIRRVFIHFFFPDREKVRDNEIIPLVERTLDRKNPREWYSALMDYGALLKSTARKNPNRRSAHYSKQSKFEGSDRQIRGALLRELLGRGEGGSGLGLNEKELITALGKAGDGEVERVRYILDQLKREGFVWEKKGRWIVSEE